MDSMEYTRIQRFNPAQNINYIFTGSGTTLCTMVEFACKNRELITTATNSHLSHLAVSFKFKFYSFCIVSIFFLSTSRLSVRPAQ